MSCYAPSDVDSWLRAVRPFNRPAPRPDPGRSALLVIDMQQHFAGIAAPIVATVAGTVSACRELGVAVFFTQHGHADPQEDGGMLHEWWGELIQEGTPDHELLEVGARDGDAIVRKRRYDAFFGTDLQRLLDERGAEDIAIAGVMTNLCVETSAHAAFVRDYRVRVLADATATASEEMHLASLVNLAFGFAHVQRTEGWLANLAR